MIKAITKEEALTLWEMGAVVSPRFYGQEINVCMDCFTQASRGRCRYDELYPGCSDTYDKIGLRYEGPCGRCATIEGACSNVKEFYIVDIPENEQD